MAVVVVVPTSLQRLLVGARSAVAVAAVAGAEVVMGAQRSLLGGVDWDFGFVSGSGFDSVASSAGFVVAAARAVGMAGAAGDLAMKGSLGIVGGVVVVVVVVLQSRGWRTSGCSLRRLVVGGDLGRLWNGGVGIVQGGLGGGDLV